MAAGERQTQKQRRKMPSFSSSLLDAIYHSIDEPTEQQHPQNNTSQVEEEIENLRRAIKIEKWMQNCTNASSNSASSTDSSIFSSETDSTSRSSLPKTTPKRESRFTRTKSRAMKLYGEFKKAKEPISPGGKLANFFNSIFSPRMLKKDQGSMEEWNSIRKSRSIKDKTTTTTTTTTCLSTNSMRSVRFCRVVDEDSHNSKYDYDCSVTASMPNFGSRFIKKNIDNFRVYEAKNVMRKHEFREVYENKSDEDDDLFELENIGGVGVEEELPVYGTTSLKINQAIASGLIM